MNTRPRGFTLIELLVVIAIIGLLSSIVLASLNTARGKAKDAARMENVRSIRTALEIYFNDHGTYPQAGVANGGNSPSVLSSYIVPTGISTIPQILIDDGDQYTWNATHGYELYIYEAGIWCNTGVNQDPAWWPVTHSPECNF